MGKGETGGRCVRAIAAVVAASLVALAGASAAPASAAGPAGSRSGVDQEASASAGPVSITAEPTLFPLFGRRIHDYVVRCAGNPVNLTVSASQGWVVDVDNTGPSSGSFDRLVPLRAGRAFTIVLRRPSRNIVQRYHVRCLPGNFPRYSFERGRRVQPAYFIVTPTMQIGGPRFPSRYTAIFNRHGVPVWWYRAPKGPSDAKLLPDRTIAWYTRRIYEIRRLDGRLVRFVRAVGVPTDQHDLQRLPGGNYLIGSYATRSDADLTLFGGPGDATVWDAEIQEVTPAGELVWSWNSKDHIAQEETGRWWPTVLGTGPPYDLVHWNSIEAEGNVVIVSMRHTDAVYAIDRGSGEIRWKLGGTPTPEQLAVLGDTYGAYPFGGQHDARWIDGDLTIYDNKTFQGPPPRVVRYRLDLGTRTATLVESFADLEVPVSICCGGSRWLPSGDWLVSWGGHPMVAGYAPGGRRTFKLSFDQNLFSYRAFPVPAGRVSATRLRNAMSVMYPRP